MRRSLLAVFGICASLGAQAALLNPDAERLEVNIPNLKGGVDFSVTLAYLEPNFHDADTAISAMNGPNPNGVTEGQEICEDFGYGAMLGWKFQNTGNDARFSVFHYEVDDTIGHSKVGRNKASGTINFEFYTYDLEAAQHINLGCRAGLRLLAGVSLHKLNNESRRAFQANTEQHSEIILSRQVDTKSCFDGIGPRVGVDFDYYLYCNFGFIAHASTALLVGSMDSKLNASGNLIDTVNVTNNKRCVTVPTLDLKLALDYSYCLRPHESIRAEFGYWVKHYFDAVNEIEFIPGAGIANYTNNLKDVSYNGWYLTLGASL